MPKKQPKPQPRVPSKPAEKPSAKPAAQVRISWQPVLLYGFIFLFFFQLVSDFVESIYAFGLLSVRIPPEIASVALFLSPLILLFFRRPLPPRALLILTGAAALARAAEVTLTGSTRLLAAGLGTGACLALLPALLAHKAVHGEDSSGFSAGLEIGAGALLGLAASILLRSLAAGSDLALSQPWVAWLLAAAALGLLAWLWLRPPALHTHPPKRRLPFGITALLGMGVLSSLAVLYFAFASPIVMARWSAMDERILLGALALALGLYAFALTRQPLARILAQALPYWNVAFVLFGIVATWANQVIFPASAEAFPLPQPETTLAQQIPLVIFILLSPVVLHNLNLLGREIIIRQPSPRALAGGFAIGSLYLLVIIIAQACTTVYDYIPVIGPWFRDRFWLVFLLAGVGMALPALAVRTSLPTRAALPLLGRWWLPASVALLLAGFAATLAFSLVNAPAAAPAESGAPLRILTYNIQQGYSEDGVRYYEGQLALIRSLQPDIIGLQETDTARFSGGNADLVRTLSQGLQMYAYYGPRTVTGTFGIALLSRYPIENPRTFFMYSEGEQTAAIEAQVSVAGKKYNLLVTHLGNGGPMIQQQQVLQALQQTALKTQDAEHIIAMGDFNFRPTTDQYALTTQALEDAWVLAGSSPTAGVDPAKRIDHVFLSSGIKVVSARYIRDRASDHPALLVEIVP